MRLFCIKDSHAIQPQFVNACVKRGHMYTMLNHYPAGTIAVVIDGQRHIWPDGCYTLMETGSMIAHDTILFVPVEEDQVDETETVYEREKVLVELKDNTNGKTQSS